MRRLDGTGAPKKIAEQRRGTILRRFIFAILLLLFIDTALWAFVCLRLDAGLREAIAAARLQGWALSAAGAHWGGWPFVAAIDLEGVVIAGNAPAGFRWRSEHAALRLSPLRPRTLVVPFTGQQSVEAAGLPAVPFTAATTRIEGDLTGATPIHVILRALRATLPDGTLGLERADIRLPPQAIDAELVGLALPGVPAPVTSLSLQARIEPPFPLAATPRQSAQAWHADSGTITVSRAALHWDALEATGSLTASLDERLQPQAEGRFTATGLPALLDELVAKGSLTAAQAGAANAVLALLAAPSGGKQVSLPVALRDGIVSIARYPLLRFPPLVWQ